MYNWIDDVELAAWQASSAMSDIASHIEAIKRGARQAVKRTKNVQGYVELFPAPFEVVAKEVERVLETAEKLRREYEQLCCNTTSSATSPTQSPLIPIESYENTQGTKQE